MSLWLLAAASKGVKKGLFLDNKDVNKSSGFSKGGENFSKDREGNLDSQKRTVCPLRKKVDSFRGAVAALGVTGCAPDVNMCSSDKTVCLDGKGIDSFKGAEAALGMTGCVPGVTVCSPVKTVCLEGKGVDSFKGAEAALGMTECVPGRTVCPPMGTRGTLVRAGDSYGAGGTRRKGRSPKETVCPLFSSYKPIEAVKKKGKNILPLFQRASSGLFNAQACVSKTLGHVNKVKTKRELVKLVKGPSFDKISKVQDSLKSVPGYEEIFQLVPRASHENGDPEVGVCEQVKGGQSLGSDWSDISELIKINLSSALSVGSKDKYQRHWHFFTKFCNFFDRVPLPASSFTVSAFLSFKAEAGKGMGGVLQARSALRHFHVLHFPEQKPPTDSLMVSGVIKGIRRRFQLPCRKKKPLNPKDFDILLTCITEKGNLGSLGFAQLRFAAQISVLYLTFARWEETAALLVKNVRFSKRFVVISYPKGKNFQFGESRKGVMVGGLGLTVDPVEVVKFYLGKLSECSGRDDILFPAMRAQGKKTAVLPKVASYNAVLSQFRKFASLACISGKPKDYGLHSFRRGAVTGAVNRGCDDHTVAKQMRVKGKNIVGTYATLSAKKLSTANTCLFKNVIRKKKIIKKNKLSSG